MMMKNRLSLFLAIMALTVFALSNVSAGDFKINNATGSQMFTVSSTGNVNATGWISENGVKLTDTYCALGGCTITGGLNIGTAVNAGAGDLNLSGTYYGDGSGLTGISVSDDSLQLDYHNITNIPTCSGTQRLYYDGTDLSCSALVVADNSVLIAGENITSGTIAEARLPSTIYTIGLNASLLNVGTIPTARIPTLDYHNITGIPTCTGTERLLFNGADFTCNSTSAADFTNVAFYNNSNTWAEDQVYDKDINLTGNLRLMTNDSAILRDGSGTNITMDSSGNVIITLA